MVADIEAGVQTVLQPWLASPSSTAVADAAVQDLATDLVRCGWFHVAVGVDKSESIHAMGAVGKRHGDTLPRRIHLCKVLGLGAWSALPRIQAPHTL